MCFASLRTGSFLPLLTSAFKVGEKKEKEIDSLYQQIEEAKNDLECFQMMSEIEEKAIPIRVKEIKERVENQKEQEKELNVKYQKLLEQKANVNYS